MFHCNSWIGFNLQQNIHFGAKVSKIGILCTFFVSFFAIKKNHKESTKEKKEKTCCCLERSNERGSNGCCRRTVCTLTRAMVHCVHTPAEQGRSYFNRSRVDGVSHRLRKSVGSADVHPFNRGARSAL